VKLGIVIPWRETRSRVQNFEAVYARHQILFPKATFYRSDSVGERFNPSEARNRGCLTAFEDGCEIVAVLDADTLFEKRAIEDAIKYIKTYGGLCYAYTTTAGLGEDQTRQILNDINFDPFAPGEYGSAPLEFKHVGSGWAMTKDGFYSMMGWDENFEGWGYEDTAFDSAYTKMFGKEMYRANGNCIRLFHGERDTETLENNRVRFEMYDKASKEEVEEIIKTNILHIKDLNVKG
jgi:hypothetical protein